MHTVLREPDAADFDLPGVLAWLRRWRANVYAVNGGGLCAFYRTAVPLQRQNRFLAGRDLLAEIVEACHGAGIKVVARMDFRGLHREQYEAHPDWAAYDADGRPKAREVLYGTCPNSPFRNEGYAIPVIDEVLGRGQRRGRHLGERRLLRGALLLPHLPAQTAPGDRNRARPPRGELGRPRLAPLRPLALRLRARAHGTPAGRR